MSIMKHRYKMPINESYKNVSKILNAITKFYPTLFSEKEIRLARIELGILEEEENEI